MDIFKGQNSTDFGKEFTDDVACKRYGKNGFSWTHYLSNTNTENKMITQKPFLLQLVLLHFGQSIILFLQKY